MSLQEFLTMGKHGLYVWSSYGMTLVVVVGLWLVFSWYKKQLIKKVKSQSTEKSSKARKIKTEQISE